MLAQVCIEARVPHLPTSQGQETSKSILTVPTTKCCMNIGFNHRYTREIPEPAPSSFRHGA